MAELPSNWLVLMIAEGDGSAPLATGSILLKFLSVIVLVAANGFFVAAEFALVGVRTSRIETMVASGNRAAKRLMGLLKNLNAYLSACQLGITRAS
jgi:CBS domain containing-hemolysin-like protein